MNRIRQTLTCPPIVTLLSVKAAVDSFTLSTTDPRLSTLDLLIISYSTFIRGSAAPLASEAETAEETAGQFAVELASEKPLVSLLLNWLQKHAGQSAVELASETAGPSAVELASENRWSVCC